MKFLPVLLGFFLFVGCVSEQKQSEAFKKRMHAEADSLSTFNQTFIEAYQRHQEDLGAIWLMQYRQRLSDRLLFLQYDFVPPEDSMLWLTGMHVYRQYHEQTYGLLAGMALKPFTAEQKDSIRVWETALWQRCGDILSPEFSIPDSCYLHRLIP